MIKRRRTRRSFSLHNFLIPHKGNNYKPILFTAGSIAVVIGLLVLFEAAYLVDTKLVQERTNFLASVLPGVLATLTNADRESNGVSALVTDPLLSKAAQMKADDMATNGYFAHVSPTGKTPWYWLEQVGYKYTYAGENLAVNFSDSQAVENAWMASPTHHANIVKPQYTRVGFGVATGMYEGKQTTFVVQEFATPAGTPAGTALAQAPEKPKTIVSGLTTIVQNVTTASPKQVPIATTTPPAPVVKPSARALALARENAARNATITPTRGTTETASTTNVLGSQTDTPDTSSGIQKATGFFAQVAASPTHTSTYVLSAVAALMAVLLFIAVFIHLRIQYIEVIGGGFLVVAFAIALLVFNATSAGTVQVPGGGQSASVVNAVQ